MQKNTPCPLRSGRENGLRRSKTKLQFHQKLHFAIKLSFKMDIFHWVIWKWTPIYNNESRCLSVAWVWYYSFARSFLSPILRNKVESPKCKLSQISLRLIWETLQMQMLSLEKTSFSAWLSSNYAYALNLVATLGVLNILLMDFVG